jgi:hypothetical protein
MSSSHIGKLYNYSPEIPPLARHSIIIGSPVCARPEHALDLAAIGNMTSKKKVSMKEKPHKVPLKKKSTKLREAPLKEKSESMLEDDL